MTVTCPNCKTTYNFPDDKARPGAKLRCTVCRQVFVLPAPDAPEPAAESMPVPPVSDSAPSTAGPDLSISIGEPARRGKGRRKTGIALLLLLVLAGGGGLAWKYTSVLDPLKNTLGLSAPLTKEATEAEQAARLAALVGELELRGVRQYIVHNDKIDGNISVIEGRVVNGFDEPRSLIKVEASLYDSTGKLLISKPQVAGSMVSLFQLQVLSEQELENALTNNKLDIVVNNMNVPPGGTVPFMLVFYKPPEDATDFSVRVIGASLPVADDTSATS